MPIRYRKMPYGMGETLFGNLDELEGYYEKSPFMEWCGLSEDEVVEHRVLTTPFPYTVSSSLKTSAMWHPFFWFSDRQIGRYEGETDVDWAMRLLYGMAVNGPNDVNGERYIMLYQDDELARLYDPDKDMNAIALYRPDTGDFLDVLYAVGIDIDTPEGVERVEQWRHGAQDETLDTLDLDVFMLPSGRHPEWEGRIAYRIGVGGKTAIEELYDCQANIDATYIDEETDPEIFRNAFYYYFPAYEGHSIKEVIHLTRNALDDYKARIDDSLYELGEFIGYF